MTSTVASFCCSVDHLLDPRISWPPYLSASERRFLKIP